MSDDLELALQALHEITAEELLNRLRSGNATAAEISQAINLLKHNGITMTPSGKKPLDDIANYIPDYDESQHYPH